MNPLTSIEPDVDYIRDITINVKDYDIDVREFLNKNLRAADHDETKLVRRALFVMSKLVNTQFDYKIACVVVELLLNYKHVFELKPMYAKYLYLKFQQMIKNFNWKGIKKLKREFFKHVNIDSEPADADGQPITQTDGQLNPQTEAQPEAQTDEQDAKENDRDENAFIREAIEKYDAIITELRKQRVERAGKPKFNRGEIVGARDSEGKWWAAKVLDVFQYENKFMYYVEFLGFDSLHNECITKPYNIVPYNKTRHSIKTKSFFNKENAARFQ